MDVAYNEKAIETFTNLEHIRHKPTGYIVDRGIPGQIHILKEVLDNSADEIILNPEGGTIWICLLRDKVNGRYQVIIRDTGRGIPYKALLNAATVIGTSGKNEGGAYNASSGLFGVGSKVTCALSSRYRIISSNYLDKMSGSVFVTDGIVKDHHNEKVKIPNGVITVCEPDVHQFFENYIEFMESGYMDMVNLCKQLNIFNPKINFQFYVYDRKIPEHFWTDPIEEAVSCIDDIIYRKSKIVEYSSIDTPDKSAYLFSLWRTNSNLIFSDEVSKKAVNSDDRLSFDIKYYFTKKSATGNPQYFISVNNVVLPDKTENSATVSFMKLLRKKISKYQEDEKYKNYVLTDYKFPTLFLAIGVRYNNAELSGMTKNSFRDNTFAKQFYNELDSVLGSSNEEYWSKLSELLKSDIELRYSQFYDAPLKKAEVKKIFADLNYSVNYKECKSSDNTKCELYIVEGTSAGNITSTRDNEYQAIYETRGKPFNAATSYENMLENRKKLVKDPIYQDIMKILNITPTTSDMNNSRFNKIIIAADADANGSSIAALYIQGFYILNPKIIESGMLYIAKPPLYSMNVSKNKKLFLRDKVALMDARIKFIYKPSLAIKVITPAGEAKLDEEGYRDLCYVVNYIGNEFDQVVRSLNIPLLILERLIFGIDYLYPNLDMDKLATVFASSDPVGYVRVQINKPGKYLIISIGQEDHIIGLDSIIEVMKNHILPLVIRYKYKNLMFMVKSKHKDAAMNKYKPMSMMMLYICMKQLNELFKVSRYKGLGEMEGSDCYTTLMNPETRSLTHISNIGDPEFNYKLIGKDSTERKRLLADTKTISAMFIRSNNL